jgi:hypothetical protein
MRCGGSSVGRFAPVPVPDVTFSDWIRDSRQRQDSASENSDGEQRQREQGQGDARPVGDEIGWRERVMVTSRSFGVDK